MGKSLDEYAGNVEETFNNTKDPLDDVTIAMNQMKDIGSDIVETSAPMLSEVMGTLRDIIKDLSDKWNSLNADTQALVKQCMRDAEAFQRAKCAEAEQACRDKIDASGVSHVYDVEPALLAEIQAAVAPAYDMVRATVGDELVDAYFAAAGFKG